MVIRGAPAIGVSAAMGLALGARQVAAANMQVGDMMAFLQYSMLIVFSFLMLSMMFIILPRAFVSGDRIGEVLATHDETQRQALYRDILTRLHDEAVYLPISYISMMVVSKPELGNIPYAPIATEIPFEQIKPVKP